MILLRHGQTISNAVFSLTRIDPGIVDPPLTPEGKRQIAAAAEKLAELPLRRVVSSPYTRALEAAEIIASRMNLQVAVEHLVGERCHFACDIGRARSRLLTGCAQRAVSVSEEVGGR